jgi:phenylalanine-4-hydroxylase
VTTNVIGWNGQPAYISFGGPVQLAISKSQLNGHGKDYHAHGFGSPVGKIKGIATPPENLTKDQLEALEIKTGNRVDLEFESGVRVKGVIRNLTRHKDKNILFSFSDCMVTYQDKALFQPSWGIYDMAIGSEITSCFSGPADPDAYGFEFPVPREKTHKIEHSQHALALHKHYSSVRKIRENGGDHSLLHQIAEDLLQNFPQDWLLHLEIHEILESADDPAETRNKILRHLKQKAIDDESLLKLIQDGLAAEKS